jgi:hypothetical protein
MLGSIKTINGKATIFYTSFPFEGYLKREDYYKIEIVNYDSSNLEKGYITLYFNDMERGAIMQTNLMIKHLGTSDAVLPLEKLIKMALAQKYEQEVECTDAELDILIGLECQFLVEKVSNYYNVTDAFPIDEELGEFISKHRLPDEIVQRVHRGIFN